MIGVMVYMLATLISIYFAGFLILAAWAFIEEDDRMFAKRDLIKFGFCLMIGAVWPWILYDTVKRKFF